MGRTIFRPRPGIALILVIAVMAIAAVMAYAMLSAGVTQEQVSYNSIAEANADALAESGVCLAMYYLSHPSTAPVTPPYSKSGITFESLAGTDSLSVGSGTKVSTGANAIGYEYPVTSTATVNGITRAITATLLLNENFQAPQAVSGNSSITLSSHTTVTSSTTAIVCSGAISLSGAVVNGNTYSTNNPGSINGTAYTSASIAASAPSYGQVRSYATYTYNGQTCTADTLAASVTSAPTASSANPAGIFISAGNVTVSGTVSISGTLIVNGNLTLGSSGTNLTVTPVAADSAGHTFPAVVVNGYLEPLATNRKATLNGLCLLQNGIEGSAPGTGCSVTINGGLLLPSTALTSYSGTLAVTYNSATATVGDLTTSVTTPESVRIAAWSD